MRLVKLSFLAPVHFGDGRLSGSAYAIAADTLFSALFIESLRLGADESLLQAARSSDCLLSDAFPYIGDRYYLPRPMLPPHPDAQNAAPSDRNAATAVKAMKQLDTIPSDAFDAYRAGTLDAPQELSRFNPGTDGVQTKVNLTKPEAKPYHVGGFTFADNAGLYFLVQGEYDLTPLLKSLQYSGLGGERSSGYGRFEYKVLDPVPASVLPRSTSADGAHMLLASAAPTDSELSDDLLAGARYRLRRRGGFVQSTAHAPTLQKKRDFYTFAAGSVFQQRFAGDVFDVNATPGAHPVYRYARAMWLEV
jgi:CRISPR-associated protein Csm4